MLRGIFIALNINFTEEKHVMSNQLSKPFFNRLLKEELILNQGVKGIYIYIHIINIHIYNIDNDIIYYIYYVFYKRHNKMKRQVINLGKIITNTHVIKYLSLLH